MSTLDVLPSRYIAFFQERAESFWSLIKGANLYSKAEKSGHKRDFFAVLPVRDLKKISWFVKTHFRHWWISGVFLLQTAYLALTHVYSETDSRLFRVLFRTTRFSQCDRDCRFRKKNNNNNYSPRKHVTLFCNGCRASHRRLAVAYNLVASCAASCT